MKVLERLRAFRKWMDQYAVPFIFGLVFGQILLLLALGLQAIFKQGWP